MKTMLFGVLGFVLMTSGCTMKNTSAADASFQKLSDDFLTGYLDWRPQYGVALGLHEYDGKAPDYSRQSIDNELARLKEYLGKMDGLDTTSMSERAYYDFRILRSGILNEIFNIENMGSYWKNPMSYPGGIDVSIYIKRDFAPLDDRVRSLIAIEETAPKLFADARANLNEALPRPYVETAIQIVNGSAEFLAGDVVKALKDLKNDSLRTAFKKANDGAIRELKSFAGYLQKTKLPKATGAYAIGEDNYRRMLYDGEMVTMKPEAILAKGMEELKKEQETFNAAAKVIDPDKKPVDVYHDMQKDHPTAANLIKDVRDHTEMIRQFVVDHHIVTMPSDVRVKVEETPQYARSTSTASMDTPGPFEKKATEAYYYVTPVDPKWTAKQKEDWLRMFDYYTTDNVTVHEAYPGHYTQFLHLNASSASKIEKIFGSYAFIEGWAHYAEKMMLDEGFGNTGDPVKAAKYRLAQSGDALLRLCRLCVSIKMHTQGMTVDEGTKFFMDNWYQGEKPSRQEAIRGTFDPGYLYYTLGKLEILKLREDYRKQEGANFSLEKFHDLLLDNGMPPIRLLRELLLKDKSTWNDIL